MFEYENTEENEKVNQDVEKMETGSVNMLSSIVDILDIDPQLKSIISRYINAKDKDEKKRVLVDLVDVMNIDGDTKEFIKMMLLADTPEKRKMVAWMYIMKTFSESKKSKKT